MALYIALTSILILPSSFVNIPAGKYLLIMRALICALCSRWRGVCEISLGAKEKTPEISGACGVSEEVSLWICALMHDEGKIINVQLSLLQDTALLLLRKQLEEAEKGLNNIADAI